MQAKLKELADDERAHQVRLYFAMTPDVHNLIGEVHIFRFLTAPRRQPVACALCRLAFDLSAATRDNRPVISTRQAAAAAAILVWLAPRQAPGTRSRTAIPLPVERASNVFFARATINGLGPFWLTVDTGATLTVIDPGAARQAGLVVRDAGRRPNVGVASGEMSMAATSGARIEVGDVPAFAPPRLYVVAVRANAGYLGHAVDGVLGTDFLRRYIVEFDYADSQVTLRPPSAARPDASASVPFTAEGNVLIAPATLTLPDGDHLPARLLIDTGSNGALTLTSPFVRRHRLTTRFQSRQASATVGINGTVFSPVVTLRSVAFGDAVIGAPDAALSRAVEGLNASEDFDGMIGAELLRRFTVTVDYSRHRLILDGARRGAPGSPPHSASGSKR